jgi:hypothetical protein
MPLQKNRAEHESQQRGSQNQQAARAGGPLADKSPHDMYGRGVAQHYTAHRSAEEQPACDEIRSARFASCLNGERAKPGDGEYSITSGDGSQFNVDEARHLPLVICRGPTLKLKPRTSQTRANAKHSQSLNRSAASAFVSWLAEQC